MAVLMGKIGCNPAGSVVGVGRNSDSRRKGRYKPNMDVTPAFDASTLEFYEANARSYVESRPEDISPDLMAFLPRLKAGSLILELGCGSGHDAFAMEKLGFRVDATDGVAAMAAIANERLARGARLMRFDQLYAENEYDAVVACASLLHVPANEMPTVLSSLWKALKPGGWHFASFKTGSSSGWDKHGRYYNYLDQGSAEKLYRSVGPWSELIFDGYEGVGYFSEPSRWLTVAAQKA